MVKRRNVLHAVLGTWQIRDNFSEIDWHWDNDVSNSAILRADGPFAPIKDETAFKEALCRANPAPRDFKPPKGV